MGYLLHGHLELLVVQFLHHIANVVVYFQSVSQELRRSRSLIPGMDKDHDLLLLLEEFQHLLVTSLIQIFLDGTHILALDPDKCLVQRYRPEA